MSTNQKEYQSYIIESGIDIGPLLEAFKQFHAALTIENSIFNDLNLFDAEMLKLSETLKLLK